jgi:hypothetical protein
MLHYPIDPESLAKAVSRQLGKGNDNLYRFQEECGTSETTTYIRLRLSEDISKHIVVGVNTIIPNKDLGGKEQKEARFSQNIAFLEHAKGQSVSPMPRKHGNQYYSYR